MQVVPRSTVAPIPTLDELASAPERARDLPAHVAEQFLIHVAALLPLLIARSRTADTASTPTPSGKDAYLSISQVADRLNVPKSYAYELCRQQKLRAVRMGKYVRVSERALADYQATLAQN